MSKLIEVQEYERIDGPVIAPRDRIKNFNEFHKHLSLEDQRLQGGRCLECGVPFCQYGDIIGAMVSGCPLHNLIPETNDLIYRGAWEQAYHRLSITHGLPEFTARVCPALCEKACTHGLHTEPVSTKENEWNIIEHAFNEGYVKEITPEIRTGKTIAIIGSGPAGLSAAQQLNRRGHKVTVYERSDRPGGLLRYGIPNMKLDKRIIDRRLKLMKGAGIDFICNVNVGVDVTAEELRTKYDRVILCTGASQPRDIDAPGRDANGIFFAVDFLSHVSRHLMDMNYDHEELISKQPFDFGPVKDKNVIVIGGGDTGNDCVGTCIRLGAANVTQLEMMPEAPAARTYDNPWPEWPKVKMTDYGQEEASAIWGADPRVYQTTVKEFLKDENGHLRGVITVNLKAEIDKESGRLSMVPIAGSEQEISADFVLICAGFSGSQSYLCNEFGVKLDVRSNISTEDGKFKTSVDDVFTAGDAHRGQSLVVWAIAEGRMVAKEVDEDLMGYSNL